MIQHYLITVSNDQNKTTVKAIATAKTLAQLKTRCLESMNDFVETESTITMHVAKTNKTLTPGVDLVIDTGSAEHHEAKEIDELKVVNLE